jgi:hypothetical protein
MYAKELLNREDRPKFYRMCRHAHQSSFECVSSQLRDYKRYSAATVPKGLLAQTVKNGLDSTYTSMKKGKMYDDELFRATETHNDSANIFDRSDARRAKQEATRSLVNGWSDAKRRTFVVMLKVTFRISYRE